MGLGAALNIAGNALNVFSTGVQVTGQNLTNATTPGYIVEHLNLQTAPSCGVSPLVLGSGVQAAGVTQQVNQYLQQQILGANSDYSSSNQLNSVYTALQQQLQALANKPSSASLNADAVEAGTELASSITTLNGSVNTERANDNTQVQQLVSQA